MQYLGLSAYKYNSRITLTIGFTDCQSNFAGLRRISVGILEHTVEDAELSGTLSLVTTCLLSFAGFPGFSDLIHIRLCDIPLLGRI